MRYPTHIQIMVIFFIYFTCERATPKSKAFNVCAVHRDKKDGIQVETLEVVEVQSKIKKME